MAQRGEARPTGTVRVDKIPTNVHQQYVDHLLEGLTLPDDQVRVWSMVIREGDVAELTVRAGASDVSGEARVPLPPALVKALDALIAETVPAARADLRRGIAKTLAAAENVR